jgi:cleavage stimulation factor subunit 2
MPGAAPSTSVYGPGGGGSSGSQQKHDIFVGNLAFNTTEEQLHQVFSEIGRVLNVRMVTDQETGKLRGFAFVEFEEPEAALLAIRNMNEYELNGRRLRVNFSNSSHLEALAGKLGMDLSQQTQQRAQSKQGPAAAASAGTTAVADALRSFSKGEMYDVIAKLKEIADRDPDEARRIIAGHPQLPEALLFLMSKLDMVKTPLPEAAGVLPTTIPVAAVAARPADPRAAATAAAAAAPPRQDPRQQAAAPRADPRQRVDPRQQQRAPPPPPPRSMEPPPPPRSMEPPPPPPMQQQQPYGAMPPQVPPGIDPALAQQVMSMTIEQIQQLPPDKQQSIMQLRQHIASSR